MKFVFYPHKEEDFGTILGHEIDVQNLVSQLLQPGDTAVDIGVHIMGYTRCSLPHLLAHRAPCIHSIHILTIIAD
jgi:hypothetical protein